MDKNILNINANKNNNNDDKFYIWDEGYFDVPEALDDDKELISPNITKEESEEK